MQACTAPEAIEGTSLQLQVREVDFAAEDVGAQVIRVQILDEVAESAVEKVGEHPPLEIVAVVVEDSANDTHCRRYCRAFQQADRHPWQGGASVRAVTTVRRSPHACVKPSQRRRRDSKEEGLQLGDAHRHAARISSRDEGNDVQPAA
jgi:hypothetical protein